MIIEWVGLGFGLGFGEYGNLSKFGHESLNGFYDYDGTGWLSYLWVLGTG